MKAESMQIRKLQRIFSAVLLIIIISIILPQIIIQLMTQVQAPPTENPQATRLMVFSEGFNIELHKPAEVTIRAVTNTGDIDTTRDDLVEVDIKSLTYLTSRSIISATTFRLQNGTAKVTIIGESTEMVVLTANWKNGTSELKPGSLTLHMGVGGE